MFIRSSRHVSPAAHASTRRRLTALTWALGAAAMAPGCLDDLTCRDTLNCHVDRSNDAGTPPDASVTQAPDATNGAATDTDGSSQVAADGSALSTTSVSVTASDAPIDSALSAASTPHDAFTSATSENTSTAIGDSRDLDATVETKDAAVDASAPASTSLQTSALTMSSSGSSAPPSIDGGEPIPTFGSGTTDSAALSTTTAATDSPSGDADASLPDDTALPTACGNGDLDLADVALPEQCDDGNRWDGDGCSSACGFERVFTGGGHTCAILSQGDVKCWGNNRQGQLGLGNDANRGTGGASDPGMGALLPTVDLGTGLHAANLALGGTHTCALLSNAQIRCWGGNSQGQLGIGNAVNRGDGKPSDLGMGDALPQINLGSGRSALGVDAGSSFTCALLDNHTVKCWGDNSFGQLGRTDDLTRDVGIETADMGNSLPTVDLGGGRSAVQIALGANFGCALLDSHDVKCWGDNGDGQLGQGDTQNRGQGLGAEAGLGDNLPPVNLGAGRFALDLAVGDTHVCVLLDNHDVKCWGSNGFGQLGQGDTMTRGAGLPGDPGMGDDLPPVNFGSARVAVALAAGARHTCALLDNHDVKCWGSNGFGRLGLGDTTNRGDGADGDPGMGDDLPSVNLGPARRPTQLSGGTTHTCAAFDDGAIKCWGENSFGQLGQGDTNSRGDGAEDDPGMGDDLPPVSL